MIVSGAPQELDFIVRICRDKVRRGLIQFSPATTTADDKYVEPADSKNIVVGDTKETKKTSKRAKTSE